jgi:hypothetical protein
LKQLLRFLSPPSRVEGVRFHIEILGLGSGVRGLGSRARCVVWGLGLKVQRLGFGVSVSRRSDMIPALQMAECFYGNPVSDAILPYKNDVDAEASRESRNPFLGKCNKHVARSHWQNPGIITVYCGCCEMLVGFSCMQAGESPRTPWEIFALRSGWCHDDHPPQVNQVARFGNCIGATTH